MVIIHKVMSDPVIEGSQDVLVRLHAAGINPVDIAGGISRNKSGNP
jgi:NADPH:quinone reductase-like Zn-dependent oxidoreductase